MILKYLSFITEHMMIQTNENSKILTPSINYIFLPFILYCLALFIMFPTGAQIIIQLVCERTVLDSDCSSAEVSSKASMISLYTSLMSSIPAILLSGVYGSVADRYGRKVVMFCSFSGFLFYSCCYCYVAIVKPSYYFIILLFASFSFGMSGSVVIYLMSVFSYASDVTTLNPSERSQRYSQVEACLYFAKVVGPLCSGLWASKHGFVTPILSSTGFLLVGLSYLFVIPESLPKDASCRNTQIGLKDIFRTFTNIKLFLNYLPVPSPRSPIHPSASSSRSESSLKSLSSFTSPTITKKIQQGLSPLKLNSSPPTTFGQNSPSPLPLVIFVFFLYYVSTMGESALFFIYMKHMYSWGPAKLGYFISIEAILQMFTMLILPYILSKLLKMRLSDIFWIHTGICSRTTYWILFATLQFSSSGIEIFALLPLLGLCGPLHPRTRSLISNSVPPEYQARIFSAFSAVEAIGSILAHLFNVGYAYSVHSSPHLMFMIMGSLGTISTVVTFWLRCCPNKYYETLPVGDTEHLSEFDESRTGSELDGDSRTGRSTIEIQLLPTESSRGDDHVHLINNNNNSIIRNKNSNFAHMNLEVNDHRYKEASSFQIETQMLLSVNVISLGGPKF